MVRTGILYLICKLSQSNTYNETKAKGSIKIWSQNTRKPHTGPNHRQWQSGAYHLKQIEEGPSFSLTHRLAIKEKRKVINHNCVNSHACTLSQNIHIVTYHFVASDNLFKLYQKLSFAGNLPEFIDQVTIKFRFEQTFLQKCFQIYVIFGY